MYALINARIYDYKNYIESGYIIFDKKIIEIGEMTNYKKLNYQEIDCQDRLVLPSFVTGHTHFYSTFARGMSLNFNPNNFLEILKQMWWKVDHFLTLEMIYYSALMGSVDQLLNGTTTFIDHHASYQVLGSLTQIKNALNDKLKVRGVLAFETSDRFNIADCIEENTDFIKNNHSSFCSGLFGMHASLSLSDESLKRISEKLNGKGIHIHVAESLMDEEECQKKYGMTVIERLDKFNLINEKSLLVHCTHINELEMDIIKARNSTIAVNVTSNLNNAVGISQVKQFLKKGIRVISGNDGLIQSQAIEYLNIYYLGHLKNASPIGFSLADLLAIINYTYEYANNLLGTNLGSFKIGSEADILVVDYKPYTLVNEENIFSHIFFGVFPNLRPAYTFVDGSMLIENYKLNIDLLSDYQEALSQANKLWEIIKKEGNNLEFKN